MTVRRRFFSLALCSAASAALFSACGSSPATPSTPAKPTPTSVAVKGVSTLTPRQTAQFTATLSTSDGSAQDCTATGSWQSSNVTAVTVSGGLATAVAVGEADIKATCQGLTGSSHVVVGSPTFVSINIAVRGGGDNQFTARHQTKQLDVVATFSDGSQQTVTSLSTWESSDTTVASVSSSGLVTASGSGTAQIKALYRESNALWTATVVPLPAPVWRTLMLVYHSIDADYTDAGGSRRHLAFTLQDQEVQWAVESFQGFPSLASRLSNGEARVEHNIVHVTRPISTLSASGGNQYPWITDTQTELNAHAPAGSYDSVLVLWPKTKFATGEAVPGNAWGLGAGPAANGATFAVVANAAQSTWREPNTGEVWLHEWLHGVCSYYRGQGYGMPANDADGASSHGYQWSPTSGWADYYRDLMTGRVSEGGTYKGITAAAWRSGSIFRLW